MRLRVMTCGILAAFLGLGISAPASAFPDVSADRLDYVAVTGLVVSGAVQGFPDGTFRPEAPVLRGQFVKMVAARLFLPIVESDQTPFSDLGNLDTGGLYPGGYVGAAYRAGIVEGKTATVFQPYEPLSRAEAMTIAVRAAEKLRAREFRPLPADYKGRLAGYDDPVHGGNAKLAEANRLLVGIDLTDWEPCAPATRSEAARIVWNLANCFG